MKSLLNIAGSITAVATIAGAALWFDSRFDGMEDNNDAVLDSVAEVKQMVEYINVEQTFMALEQTNLHDSILKVSKEQEVLGVYLNNLVWMFRNQDTFSPEQMEQLLDQWLKKKSNQIVRITPDWSDSTLMTQR